LSTRDAGDASPRAPLHDRRATPAPDPGDAGGVEANSRITGSTGAVLFVLFAAEGATILLGVRAELPAHVFIGLLAVPPIVVKLASTGHRIVRYYLGDPRYVGKGPPPIILRILGPLVALTTIGVIVTGIVDLVSGPSHVLTSLHKLCFLAWFVVMTIHVLGHLRETPGLAAADWSGGPEPLRGTATRRLLLVGMLVTGLALAAWSLSWIPAVWIHGRGR
jgi:hypothetical protein